MGFRSTFTSDDNHLCWPEWFKEKYQDSVNFPQHTGCISSKYECKIYSAWGDLTADIQKVVSAWPSDSEVVLCFLHECEGVSRCKITKDSIKWTEPQDWESVDGVTHSYCYGCSDVDKLREEKQTAELHNRLLGQSTTITVLFDLLKQVEPLVADGHHDGCTCPRCLVKAQIKETLENRE